MQPDSIVSYAINVWERAQAGGKAAVHPSEPVKRGLVESPELWAWSSFRAYAYGERGPVRVNYREWKSTTKTKKRETLGEASAGSCTRPIRNMKRLTAESHYSHVSFQRVTKTEVCQRWSFRYELRTNRTPYLGPNTSPRSSG